MFSKFFHKQQQREHEHEHEHEQKQQAPAAEEAEEGKKLGPEDINPRVAVHYGIPSTASVLAFDPVQSILAVGTLDGRIKVIGGDNIEALLTSQKPLPFKYLEFLQNQGILVAVSNENEIQAWDLEQRQLASTLKWESNITAFSVICGSTYMYVGDEYGMINVLKYDTEEAKLVHSPYYVPINAIAESCGALLPNDHSVVGVLPQPSSQGKRVLIAYDNGLIILWDVSEDKVILVRGHKDLRLESKIAVDSKGGIRHELSDDGSDNEQEQKEISSLCWACSHGFFLAVGYVDGDIMLWDLITTSSAKDRQADKSPNDVVKLQLSSSDRRLPVIILHWTADARHNHCGRLFVYGGDAIGSEEVLTILSLDWSSGIESLKCIGRVNLTLAGSFTDMALVQSAGGMKASGTFVLTSPGQLHFYHDGFLSSLMSHQERNTSINSEQYRMIIPTIEPRMTVAKLGFINRDGKNLRALSEIVSAAKIQALHAAGSSCVPLTGGILSKHLDAESYQVERVYIGGYEDGSVRIWDATYPTFSLIYSLEPDLKGINIAGVSASVSALEFCSFTLTLAIGNELGMVRLYKLIASIAETCLSFVTETEKEVCTVHPMDGPQCTAVFSLISSPICTLQFTNFGTRLAVGYGSGQVAMVDTITSSVLFLTDSLSNLSSPVHSLVMRSFSDTVSLINNLQETELKTLEDQVKWEVLVMVKDAHSLVVDASTGSVIGSDSIHVENDWNAVSMYVIECGNLVSEVSSEMYSLNLSKKNEPASEPAQTIADFGSAAPEVDQQTSSKTAYFGQKVENFLLLCYQEALLLYSLKSWDEGDRTAVRTVNLLKPCCWTTTFRKDDKECGLVVLYQTGDIEIRSLPELEVVAESSLMSILRWNFKTNMEKTICSSDRAQIMLVNGCEFVAVSLLASENDFRIPESLPCLHDKVLEAAADTIVNLSPNHEKAQGVPGILGGFIKGFQKVKAEHVDVDSPEVCMNNFAHLDGIFSSPPFLKPSLGHADDQGVVELSIDDIDIDEPLFVSSLSGKTETHNRDKGSDRERLFEGGTKDSAPRLRTAEEIKAKYRKEDASAAAAHAKDKLMERQEKLERLSLRTEELQNGAESFASMASELAKQMEEKRKWWQL